MLVKSILGVCLKKMGSEDYSSADSYTPAQQETLNRLLAGLNLAYREATAAYLPLIKEEDIAMPAGGFSQASLSRPFLFAVRLTTPDGVRHPVRTYHASLKSDFDGPAKLTYAYLSPELSIEDDLEEMRIAPETLADGTLAEYYFADKLFDLASAYDTQFRAALSSARYKGRELRLKTGRWGA